MPRTAIFIPARMESSRFPGKPLADIHGKPMILHVWERARQVKNVQDVFIACCEQKVYDTVSKSGAKALMTNPSHPSGTDRIYEALQQTGQAYDIVVNIQGDLPTLDPAIIEDALKLLQDKQVDIATLAAPITRAEERTSPHVVKAVIALEKGKKHGRALYFSRATIPYGEGELYHHIGLYAYRTKALEKFVSLPPSPLELREKLEQLRALEAGMRIDISIVDTVPLGVDTPEDLERVKKLL